MSEHLLSAFFISDLLFPIWLLVILFICMKMNIDVWKGWLIASTFCMLQSFLVAKFIGWNAGIYFIYFLSIAPLAETEWFTNEQLSILFYVAPPIVMILAPAIILYFLQKIISKKNENNTSIATDTN